MTKTGPLKFFLFFFIVSPALGQKVKYKDIFALLSTKQYEQAEPFLKRYLKENDDNPNAFLYQAIIFQEKSSKIDILKNTRVALANMDSAILFFDRAHKAIDDREVRKNKEYYQAYNRRDLRTGEFGVKLSDIQFDIEKKMEGLRERIDKVKMTKHFFSLADTLYKRSNALYRDLQSRFPSELQLYLRADENALQDLRTLSARFDSCTSAFENYKTSTSNLGNTGYNQTFSPQPIKDFKRDGTEQADFYADEPRVWDYKEFAGKTLGVVTKEIAPMREHLITYDIEINKLRDKLTTDSVSVRNDLTKLIDKLLYDQLKKFDPDPLPMEVFSLKTADLEYRSALLENRALRDSADIPARLAMIQTEMKYLNKLDSVATKLSGENIDEKALDYQHFITNTYSSALVLKSYIKALKEYAEREKRDKETERASTEKALEFIVDGNDSIPLRDTSLSRQFKPLVTNSDQFTAGLHLTDSTHADGYFYTITPSRRTDVKARFPVEALGFTAGKVASAKGLGYADGSGQLYFVLIYSDQLKADKYPAMLAKIYRTDGLAWSNNIQLSFIPKEINLKPDTGELIISNDAQQTVVDKNGKVLR